MKEWLQCFFIPNKWRSEKQWNKLIQAERSRLEEILDLGLKAQKFEETTLTITSESGQSYTINVLCAQVFKSLAADKGIFCGLYGFFARSYIKDTMTLDEMVNHAKGLSKEGKGSRSLSVMRDLGWLDKNNEEKGDLHELKMM